LEGVAIPPFGPRNVSRFSPKVQVSAPVGLERRLPCQILHIFPTTENNGFTEVGATESMEFKRHPVPFVTFQVSQTMRDNSFIFEVDVERY